MKSEQITQIKTAVVVVIGAIAIAAAGYFAGAQKANKNDDQLPSLAMETSSHVMALETALLVMARDLNVSPEAMKEMVDIYSSVQPARRDFEKHFAGK